MDFQNSPAEEAFRKEVRAFLKEAVTPEYLEERRTQLIDDVGHGPATARFVAQLQARGWLTLHWPTEYGGQGRSLSEQAIFAEEIVRAGGSIYLVGSVGLNTVAPALMVYGSEEQKRTILPRVASGEILFCQLFTEPTGGSDLAALTTQAVRDGDSYIVNGTKIFTTKAHLATHGYLLARTDSAAPKHRGLSLFVLEMNSPGIEIRPLPLIDGIRHNMVHFTDVRIPHSGLLGEENRGWYHAAVTLDYERAGAIGRSTEREQELDGLMEYARNARQLGQRLSSRPAIRSKLVSVYRDVRIVRALGLRNVDIRARGLVPNAEASEWSLFDRELRGRLAEAKALVYGMAGQLIRDTPYAVDDGEGVKSWWVLAARHGGGTMEIQKNVIAQRGLGLPRS